MPYDRDLVERVLTEARAMVLEEIALLVERNRETGYGPLYDLVSDYPFREGKGLRPALLLSAARAAGGVLRKTTTGKSFWPWGTTMSRTVPTTGAGGSRCCARTALPWP